ncbi:MAG: vitamin K epoxide reductase family protein [Candidatus Atelocyanobacterium thalassa]
MIHKRSIPVIYRWARYIIGMIAISGTILTAYLTIAKLTGTTVYCGVNDAQLLGTGCKNVLNSRYATVFNLPLSLFGTLAYISMSVASLGPLLLKSEKNKNFIKKIDEWTWQFLLIGGTAMAVFSSYLIYILSTELYSTCYYCLASFLLSLALMIFSILGKEWEDIGQTLFVSIIVTIVTLVGILGIYTNTEKPLTHGRVAIKQVKTVPHPPNGWPITSRSEESEIKLAEHLTSIGAKMYGAFWCPHCHDQKQLFGLTAFHKINYIECDPRGKNPQPNICISSNIKSYPSWEINGEQLSGAQSLEDLAKSSNYQGLTDFKYIIPEHK